MSLPQAFPMNILDTAIYAAAMVALIMGFNSGLLRSLATILGYVAAAPIALALAPPLILLLTDQFHLPAVPTWVAFCGVFMIVGILLAALLRTAVGEIVGPTVSLPDRIAGSALGAARIGLLAVLMVLMFEQIIPFDREPAFLTESRLRPILSAAGHQGLRTFPPDVVDLIERFKRERRM
jgi:membrane protein required for colicin V production